MGRDIALARGLVTGRFAFAANWVRESQLRVNAPLTVFIGLPGANYAQTYLAQFEKLYDPDGAEGLLIDLSDGDLEELLAANREGKILDEAMLDNRTTRFTIKPGSLPSPDEIVFAVTLVRPWSV